MTNTDLFGEVALVAASLVTPGVALWLSFNARLRRMEERLRSIELITARMEVRLDKVNGSSS